MIPDLSIVIPVYNEQENLPELSRRLTAVLEREAIEYEIIFVNDGSRDSSLLLLRGLAAENRRIRALDFSRNFGHQAALYAGMCHSSGRAVVLMDGDLQDPPEVVPRLLERWREGFEVVFAVRTKRKESVVKRLAYATYYRLLRSVSYVEMPLDSGDFSLMDRRVVNELVGMPERNKFLRGLRSWVGFRQTSVIYERDARYAGEPKYTLSKLLKLAFDGLVSYSYMPLRVAFVMGVIVSSFSFLLGAIYFMQRILLDVYIPPGWTTLAVLILFLGGVQLLSVGLIGEYIGRIYDEVKRRPEFIVRETIGSGEIDEPVRMEVSGAALGGAPFSAPVPYRSAESLE